MQHYLKDGHEDKQMVFHKGDVVAYNQLFEQKLETFISPLYCASLWPEFELFQPFIARNLLLKSTEIEYFLLKYNTLLKVSSKPSNEKVILLPIPI